MKISTIILAAGKSSRMKSSTLKLLHKIANKPIINFVIDSIKPITNGDIVAVIREDDQTVKDHIAKTDASIKFRIQEQEGTAGATKSGLKGISSDYCLIICGDTPLITTDTLSKLQEKVKSGYDLALIAFENDRENQYGRLVIENDRLIRIVEFKEASEAEKQITLCNSAIMMVRTDLLHKYIHEIQNNNAKSEYYLTDIIEILAKNNHKLSYIKALEEEVLGINNRIELANAEKLYQNKLRAQMMEQGVGLIDPDTVFFSHDTIVGEDSIIHPFVMIGENVKISGNVTIKSFCHLEGVTINEHAVIGPYARIRPDTVIASKVQIGNFVEIKNSAIGLSSKINHLSYIGDTTIGKSSNIGAGTITCNYNGVKKFNTNIGDNVFVGSNSSLIAPLAIEDNATIAAGSVVNKHVPEKSLAISRAKIEIKANWVRKR
jgi:bifunctional UDP-N-acetylglucosamine pyrophosphorylase/glucosamine-1-phosphate N-acetyltransferase